MLDMRQRSLRFLVEIVLPVLLAGGAAC
jgi:hypothetical protein